MLAFVAAALCSLAAPASAQQAGTVVAEAAPGIVIQKCTAAGCEAEEAVLTLDANWRWLHDKNGYENCYKDGPEGGWDPELCPDGKGCAFNCSLEGVDAEGYRASYGVKAMPGGVELDFVAEGGNVGSRVYVRDSAETYKMWKLKNREFTLDVDVSTLACGMNGAVYFIEMEADGGKGTGNNTAGAMYGTGYCDAQCPYDVKYQEGEVNMGADRGMCCHELDIWEANARAKAFTTHPCSVDGPLRCEGLDCGGEGDRYKGVCDKDGCDLNPFRMGDHSFYGAGMDFQLDSSKPMTVVTQFLTEDGTDTGDLAEIRRIYVQDGKIIHHANSSTPGIEGNSLTDGFCSAMKTTFGDVDHHLQKGGLKKMGEALDRGLVLALSIWDDGSQYMRWLDSIYPPGANATDLGVLRGPCDGTTSDPDYVREHSADATVKYLNLKYGEIGTTFSAGARRLSPILM